MKAHVSASPLSFARSLNTPPLWRRACRAGQPLASALLLAWMSLAAPPAAQAQVSNTAMVLHSFSAGTSNLDPAGALTLGRDGNFYGISSTGGPGQRGAIFQVTPAGVVTPIYYFTGGSDSQNPTGTLLLGKDGNLYGMTSYVAGTSVATVFQITTAGALETIYTFPVTNNDSLNPSGSLVQGPDGNFYGVTQATSFEDQGTFFQVTLSGSFQAIHTFSGEADGGNPNPLTLGADGNVYGTTPYSQDPSSGDIGFGTFFQYVIGSGQFNVLHTFNNSLEGGAPNSPLTLGLDNNLYGTTTVGGANSVGTIFSITTGGTPTVLYNFANNDNSYTVNALTPTPDGSFYGTTSGVEGSPDGEVFQFTPTHQFTILFPFTGGADGSVPNALTPGPDGNLYGTTSAGGTSNLGTVFQLQLPAGSLNTLHEFTYGADGLQPVTPLTLGPDGNLYGTTPTGGTSNLGTVFRTDLAGNVTTLYSFTGGADGSAPNALTLGADGNLYGTTPGDGTKTFGTFFQVTTAGALTTIYPFTGGNDGSMPNALALAPNGNFYGTTQKGGGTGAFGTVFEITPQGTIQTFHAFANNGDGATPVAMLTLDQSGQYFYGTTSSGATTTSFDSIFRVSLSGDFSVIYNFKPNTDGAGPVAPLVQGSDGNFYGTTTYAASTGAGTIFRVTPAGDTFTVLYTFTAGLDGGNPSAALIEGPDGNFYSTTYSGGTAYDGTATSNAGSIYQIIPATKTFTTIYKFPGGDGGARPGAGLVRGPDGNLYGTTGQGGTNGLGTIYDLPVTPAFFTGQVALGSGVDYLPLPGGDFFGYYAFLFDPRYFYHFDLGYEYPFDAQDGKSGVYLYDFASDTFFYTSPSFPFPYLYDFTLKTVLYYYPDPNNPGHYNLNGVRYFYDFNTGGVISK